MRILGSTHLDMGVINMKHTITEFKEWPKGLEVSYHDWVIKTSKEDIVKKLGFKPIYKRTGKCRYTSAKIGYCEYYRQIKYKQYNVSGLMSSIQTAREGRVFTSLLYNEIDRNKYPAQRSGGNGIVDGEYDYYIGSNYTTAMVASNKSYNRNY